LVIFALLDPDPDSESGNGSTDLIQSRSETLVIGGMARLRSELAFMSWGIGLGFDYRPCSLGGVLSYSKKDKGEVLRMTEHFQSEKLNII
jgi:hypothetical protein